MSFRRPAIFLISFVVLQSSCRNLDDGAVMGSAGGTTGSGGDAGARPEQETGGNGGEGRGSEELGGEGGEGGSGGDSGTPGETQSEPMSGTAGRLQQAAPSNAGNSTGGTKPTASDLDPSPEEVPREGCVTTENIAPQLLAPAGLAAYLVPNGLPYVLTVADTTVNVTLLRWKKDPAEGGAPWTNWSCFDTFVSPLQLSAINIDDQPAPYSTPEVYATNTAGKLFVRRFYKQGWWGNWMPTGTPRAASYVVDIASTSTANTLPTLYALDDGRVFQRNHESINAYSTYTPWREISGVPANAAHLCAAVRADQRQQVFVSTANGEVYTAVQASTNVADAFGAFQRVSSAPAPAMTDIDCGTLADGSLTVFGLIASKVWFLSTSGESTWQQTPVRAGLSFRVFAVGSFAKTAPTVFGLDSTNKLWSLELGSTDWTPLG